MSADGGGGNQDGRIDLTAVPDFDLGGLRVRPARRQVVFPAGDAHDLEPRVMKVLVALARARPEVVSRDALIASCWDGRVVGDGAINRCILALRQLARRADPPPFVIETVARVGYSVVENGGANSADTSRDKAAEASPAISRRTMLAVAGASIVAVAGGVYWASRGAGASSPNADAAIWYQKGVEAREQGLPHLYPQAEANFREAVHADPGFSDAWGALALAYADSVFIEQGNHQIASAERAQSAARRALELNPDSLEAQTALLLVPSEFGGWAARQAALRQLLERQPVSDYLEWLLRVKLAYSLSECGRCRDALAMSRTVAALKPVLPATWATHVYCLWAAGELEEADTESADKVARWPSHAELWVLRMAMLTYGGQAAEALAFASAGRRPPYIDSEGRIERWRATAQALASNRAEDIEQAGRLHLERIAGFYQEMLPAARFFTATGQLDTAFAILNAYYFNRGRFAIADRPPRTPLTRLNTISLFWPPMAPARRDPRFDRLTEEIGLARYWRETGTLPDYRRA